MKKYFLPISFFFACTFSTLAQVKGGIKLGGNYTNIIGPNSSDYKFKPGFHAGAFVEYDINNSLFVQGEVDYSLKGFLGKTTTTIINSTTTIKGTYNLAYIDIPLMLNIHFGDWGSYVGIGPQLSVLASSKWDEEHTIYSSKPSPTTTTFSFSGTNSDGWNKIDVGLVFGVGTKFDSGFEYSLRAGYGLTNVFDPATASKYSFELPSDSYHNLVFSISLGYAFGGGGGGGDRYGHKYKKKH